MRRNKTAILNVSEKEQSRIKKRAKYLDLTVSQYLRALVTSDFNKFQKKYSHCFINGDFWE
jgi:hypothetical protein